MDGKRAQRHCEVKTLYSQVCTFARPAHPALGLARRRLKLSRSWPKADPGLTQGSRDPQMTLTQADIDWVEEASRLVLARLACIKGRHVISCSTRLEHDGGSTATHTMRVRKPQRRRVSW